MQGASSTGGGCHELPPHKYFNRVCFYSIKGFVAPFTGALPVALPLLVDFDFVALDFGSGLVTEAFAVVADAFIC